MGFWPLKEVGEECFCQEDGAVEINIHDLFSLLKSQVVQSDEWLDDSGVIDEPIHSSVY